MKKKIKLNKSRIRLHQALIDLLLEHDYGSISIQDICHQARIGRSTFYNHYKDKNDLLQNTVLVYSQIAQETTLDTFVTEDKMDLHSNLIRDYQTTVQYNKVIQALLSVHLPNADFEVNIRQILKKKYLLLVENHQTSHAIPDDLAINLYAANALTVTKYIAYHPETADIEKLADFMLHIYTCLFQSTETDELENLLIDQEPLEMVSKQVFIE